MFLTDFFFQTQTKLHNTTHYKAIKSYQIENKTNKLRFMVFKSQKEKLFLPKKKQKINLPSPKAKQKRKTQSNNMLVMSLLFFMTF